MKHHFLGALGLGVMALLAACGSANPNSMTFVGNAQTVERVFRAFEAEDSTAFWTEFAETAVWRGTGVNAPTSCPARRWARCMERFGPSSTTRLWAISTFCLASTLKTQLPNGSVNGMFLWEVSRTDEDGKRRGVHFGYESLTSTKKAKSCSPRSSPTWPRRYRQLENVFDPMMLLDP